MITYEEALAKILEESHPLGSERAALAGLSGRILAEDIVAESDMPNFDNSGVDGYGVMVADVQSASEAAPVRLRLAGTIQAGDAGTIAISRGSTVKVMTGAVVPSTVEAVVMRENCSEENGFVTVRRSTHPSENIRRRGEEFGEGQRVLIKGTAISPPTLGLLATTGNAQADVFKAPRIALLSTGNELVAPGQPLAEGQIYDSNSYALAAAVRALGLSDPVRLHARDDEASTRQALKQALAAADVIISAGGVSVGDYDFVKDVCEALGIQTIFWRIAIKPGKPVYFGRADGAGSSSLKLVFGLPGNPVSALVTFHQLVKPALMRMMGLAAAPPLLLSATLTRTIRKRSGRLEFVRASLSTDDGRLCVTPTSGQESHMVGGIAGADCLIHFALESERLEEGQLVPVQMLQWSAV